MAGGGGPWGGNGDDKDEDKRPDRGPNKRPAAGGQIPEIDEIVKRGQEQLRVLMGGRGGNGRPNGPTGGGPVLTKQGIVVGALAAVAVWGFMSFYQVKPEESSVELLLGEYYGMGQEGLNFAPWPFVTAEIVQSTRQRGTIIGSGAGGEMDNGLMLTRDQNIVDIEFEVVWNINDPAKYLFNLADPEDTIRAVSESAMRDIIARSELAPVLNRDRGVIAADLQLAVQSTLDS